MSCAAWPVNSQQKPAATRAVKRLTSRAARGESRRSVASTARCLRWRVDSEAPRKPTQTIRTTDMAGPPVISTSMNGTSRRR